MSRLADAWEALRVSQNPIYVQHRRAKLRPLHRLSWGLIVVTITAFIFVLTYTTAANRGLTDPAESAKAALLPTIIFQSVLLMGLGTSAVATGIARERDKELLDYHRLTPMSPAAKITGYLFGLPSREYFLFFLTMPFIIFAVVRGGVPWLKVLHFYTVFFSSVWLYHLTGLMAGMVSKRPWQSSMVSLGAVAGLYLVLPQFAALGLSFFDFLTVRPTFYGMVREELGVTSGRGWNLRAMFLTRLYQDVAFYDLRLNPTVFSLVIQGSAMVTMYHVVRRKLIDPAWQPFSKRFGVAFVLAITVLLVGSLWPLLRDQNVLGRLLVRMRGEGHAFVFGVLLSAYLLICGAAMLLAIHLVTPTRQTARKGMRRALRLGLGRVPRLWDAASSVPPLVLMLAIAWAGLGVVLYAAATGGTFFTDGIPLPVLVWLMVTAVLGTLTAVTFHALNAWLDVRLMVLALFFLWVVPVMVVVITLAAFDAPIRAMYLGIPCPFVGGALSVWSMIDTFREVSAQPSGSVILDPPMRPHARIAVAATLVCYSVLAVLTSWAAARARRRMVREEVGASR